MFLTRFRTRLIPALALATTFLLLLGCGKKNGGLSGSVTLNGNPVKWAQVTAYDSKGEVVGRATAIDGKYEMTNLPAGEVTLAVQTHTPEGSPLSNPKGPLRDNEKAPPPVKKEDKNADGSTSGQIDPVPLKYTSPKNSGFKASVVAGQVTTADLAMTGKGEIPHEPSPGQKGPGQPGQPGGPPVPPPLPPGVPPPPPPK